MLSSMYSPVESDVYPPDVCFSGDLNRSSVWGATNKSDLEASSEQRSVPNAMETQNLDDHAIRVMEIEGLSQSHSDNLNDTMPVDGAVGGILPDLCVTGSSSTLGQKVNEQPVVLFNKMEDHIHSISNDYSNQSKDGAACSNAVNDLLNVTESDVDCDRTNNSSEFLVHSCKHICLVACGTGDINKDDLKVVEEPKSSDLCSEHNVCCDKFGALEKLSDLQTYGLDLVRQNLIQSSHSMYHKWECSAFIPSDFLSPVSLHSHGTPLGCDVGSAYILGFHCGRSPMNEVGPQLPEEEQIKVAKRFGLIQHLPCGIFNGLTKTRECVICMIDFSAGEKIRYLPCMHTYHTDCIDDWLMRSFTCPSCLEPVDAALLSTYETS